MPKHRDYIPKSKDKFFNFQKNFAEMVNTNMVAWGITAPEFAPLAAKRTVYEPLYDNTTNPNTKTSGDVQAHNDAKTDYIKIIRTFVRSNITANTLISDQQRKELGVPARDKVKSARPHIKTAPFGKITMLEGARIQVEARAEHDGNRTSIHEAADGLNLVYIVGTVPVNPDACNKSRFSSKAKFNVSLDIADAGKKVYCFMRWQVTADDLKSGPWSKMFTATISD